VDIREMKRTLVGSVQLPSDTIRSARHYMVISRATPQLSSVQLSA